MDFTAVEQAIRQASRETVRPHFRRLSAAQVEEKSPGEVVTVADQACERALGAILRGIVDVPVVGEEASAVDPTLLDLVRSGESVWLVDPIDGTSNFAVGDPHYAVMVAYVDGGETVASWIYQPEFDVMAVAARGAGATINGRSVNAPDPGDDPARWSGVIKDRFLPDDRRVAVADAGPLLGKPGSAHNCAGFEYPALVTGAVSFVLYWRTLPWDHGPGVLLATEAGCVAHRPDFRPFTLTDGRSGLLVAHRSNADEMLRLLLGP